MADQGVPRSRLKGSWAGALGNPQFLPSMYLRLAVDGDGDGTRDLWTSRADTLASIANYFRDAGWRAGQPWGVRASVPAGFDPLHRLLHRRLGADEDVGCCSHVAGYYDRLACGPVCVWYFAPSCGEGSCRALAVDADFPVSFMLFEFRYVVADVVQQLHTEVLPRTSEEVGEHLAQPARRGHRLVADHVCGQAHHVELRIVRQRGFGTPARTEQRALERFRFGAALGRDGQGGSEANSASR